MRHTRRHVLRAGATAGVFSTVGCLSSPSAPDNDTGELTGSGAFYTLMDWGNAIAGDRISFDTPVDTGELGHGWDPEADIVPQIAQHDVFVYLGTPEFQWAIDVAEEFQNEGRDVPLVDGMGALSASDFLPFVDGGTHTHDEPDHDHDFAPDTFEIGEFGLVRRREVVARWQDGHWDGGLPTVPAGEDIQITVHVEDREGRVPPLGSEEPFEVEVRYASDGGADYLDIDIEGSHLTLSGVESGQVELVFELRANDQVVFETASDTATVTVSDQDAVDVGALHDPHVWVDPVLAQSIVSYIADELGSTFPEHAATFEENGDAYLDRIVAVDDQFQELTREAPNDVAVLVAHDSFRYLEARYGFELRTPVGASPDAAESIEDVAGLVRTIEEYDIETILFDPFAAPDPDENIPVAASLLLDETDATNAEPLTTVAGITATWREEGYGWVEQMEQINLPSLRRALNAK